jgi:putative hydrolase of the HAD superfamily
VHVSAGSTGRVSAVCFDLDDTLFPQSEWLAGAWDAVAERGATGGIDATTLRDALHEVAAEGSDRGRIIDRALERIGAPETHAASLVAAFRTYRATTLEAYPGAREALAALGARVPLGLVSDGDPALQQAKLEALGLDDAFDVVVWSDTLGREHRKPDPLPFRVALERLARPATEVVFVGDRPEKDVVGATAAGMRVIRVRTGEWSHRPDDARAWASVETVVDACAMLQAHVAPRDHTLSTSTSTRNSNSPGANR